ncbi:hypothetical protein [Acidithiobacillus sp. HP-11]|uniref:hypothetical protein n=1 Tax=Acidithiobacillus sp. HP-11 TaxID=2697656 RepID=UPI0018794088|nr:hypothetical protein [Acidithiobacillus sp. HP-11]MBE7567484.1 hypothetical protein [Acidithiobacillus sp. HP-11]
MIKKQSTTKFKVAESYSAFWRVPVPMVKRFNTCPDEVLHPCLSAFGHIPAKCKRREAVLLYFAHRLRHLAFHRSIAAFDASFNEFWQLQQAERFRLEMMEEGGCQ